MNKYIMENVCLKEAHIKMCAKLIIIFKFIILFTTTLDQMDQKGTELRVCQNVKY